MKRSTERILTSHVGSLIRPPELIEFLRAKRDGRPVDEAAFAACLTGSVAEIVCHQAAAGVDVVSDGEFGKTISWSQYALERLSGFERRPVKPGVIRSRAAPTARNSPNSTPSSMRARSRRRSGTPSAPPRLRIPGSWSSQRDIDNFKAALARVAVTEAFLPVAAPASVIPDRKNEYYPSDDECLAAIAAAMRTEYRTIVEAGFLVQLDDARAAVTYDRMVPPSSFEDYRRWVARHVEVLNNALEGSPRTACATTSAGEAGRVRTPPMCRSRTSSTSSSRYGSAPT